MRILLAFAPCLIFAIGVRLVGGTVGLIAGTLTAIALLLVDRLKSDSAPKVLEIGTVVLFGGLALYTLLGGPFSSIIGVRLCVDAGLLLIVVISMAIGQPFTCNTRVSRWLRISGRVGSSGGLTMLSQESGHWRLWSWSSLISCFSTSRGCRRGSGLSRRFWRSSARLNLPSGIQNGVKLGLSKIMSTVVLHSWR